MGKDMCDGIEKLNFLTALNRAVSKPMEENEYGQNQS